MFEVNSDRSATRSRKVLEPSAFNNPSAISLGCADFDYDSPIEVHNYVKERAAHAIYGYTSEPPELKRNIIAYYQERHGFEIKETDIVYTSGVIGTISIVLQVFAQKGDRVLIMDPEYTPFFQIVRGFGLEPVPIKLNDGELDYAEFEEKLKQTQIFLLSNPHNPTGNAFDAKRICELCEKANVLVISDEIWADFQLTGEKHVSVYEYGFPALLAPTKTFNIAGTPFSMIAWKDHSKLQQIRDFCGRMHIGPQGCFSYDAASIAYGKCSYWVDGLIELIKGNFQLVQKYLGDRANILGGKQTALIFINFSKQFSNSDEARDFFVQNGVYLQSGNLFYCNGNCPGAWLRMNIGSPASMIEKALKLMVAALEAAGK